MARGHGGGGRVGATGRALHITLAKAVNDRSPGPVDLRLDAREIVLLDAAATSSVR